MLADMMRSPREPEMDRREIVEQLREGLAKLAANPDSSRIYTREELLREVFFDRYPAAMAVAAHDQPEEPIRSRLVSLPVPPPEGFTAADLPRLIEVVDGSFELEDGQVVMMAPADPWHDEVRDALKAALRQIAPQDVVVLSEKAIELGASAPEPDCLVVSRSAFGPHTWVYRPDDVHLAVEIVSPGTKTKDRKLRPVQYAEAGIKCFWRVENEDDEMVVYAFELLPEGGQYTPSGVFRKQLRLDRPFPIDVELPEITW
ncbi:Uma2 family endonuclease [Nocardia jiangxiensis]|uniref:Uma2 family endonuclease n=1 Tax=Nocardia jiangxiensis TaxID=282685 RepID=A0ABW6RSM9_9NOCA|nr:Uma2 family endonuclease [Nocardia jiangxiensis]